MKPNDKRSKRSSQQWHNGCVGERETEKEPESKPEPAVYDGKVLYF